MGRSVFMRKSSQSPLFMLFRMNVRTLSYRDTMYSALAQDSLGSCLVYGIVFLGFRRPYIVLLSFFPVERGWCWYYVYPIASLSEIYTHFVVDHLSCFSNGCNLSRGRWGLGFGLALWRFYMAIPKLGCHSLEVCFDIILKFAVGLILLGVCNCV